MASLIVKTGRNKGDYYPLGQRTNVIGRAESLPIQILDDKVSRKHMQIGFDKTRKCYYALDMKSKHGVFVNNIKILEETELREGDEIIIGETTLLLPYKISLSVKVQCHILRRLAKRFVLH